MFKQVLLSSLAVLRSPSVATFEAYERKNVAWALLYVALAALLCAGIGVLTSALHRPFLEAEYGDLVTDIQQAVPGSQQDSTIEQLLVPQDPASASAGSGLTTLIGYLVFICVVYVLGRVFGGRGAFGELAYDVALFWAPLSVLSALINMMSIGVFTFVAVPLGLAVGIYQLLLTFFSIRSGMNLSAGRAAGVISVMLIAVLVLFFVLVGFIVAAS